MKTVESIHAELDIILDEIRQGRMSEASLGDAMGYLDDSVRQYQREYEAERNPSCPICHAGLASESEDDHPQSPVRVFSCGMVQNKVTGEIIRDGYPQPPHGKTKESPTQTILTNDISRFVTRKKPKEDGDE